MQTTVSVDVEGDYGTELLHGVDEILPQLLDGFDERGIKAVLFVVGSVARARPAILRSAVERGHVVGSHSMTHPIFSRIDRADRQRELRESRDAISDITGRPCDSFRAPFFDAPDDLGELLDETGYTWSSSKAPFSPVALYRGLADTKRSHRLGGSRVIEVPVTRVLGLPMPQGLSYHRLFWPLPALSLRPPAMFYLHPYELLEQLRGYSHARWLRALFTARNGAWARRYLWRRLDAWKRAGATFGPPSPEALACVT